MNKNDVIKSIDNNFNKHKGNLNRTNNPEWDSITHLNILVGLEEDFEIIIEYDDFKNLASLDEIYNYVKNIKGE